MRTGALGDNRGQPTTTNDHIGSDRCKWSKQHTDSKVPGLSFQATWWFVFGLAVLLAITVSTRCMIVQLLYEAGAVRC